MLVVLLVVGCQRAPQPVAYHGEVTLDGRPLATGRIQFVVKGEPPEATDIVDGKFAGVALPGPKGVEIYGFRPSVAIPNDPTQSPELGNSVENYVPEMYNTYSTLFGEIRPNGPNEFEFVLRSASP